VCRHGFGKHTDGSCYKSECGDDAACSGNGACKKTRADRSAETILKCHSANNDHGCYTKGGTRYVTSEVDKPCAATSDRTEWCGTNQSGHHYSIEQCAKVACLINEGGLESKTTDKEPCTCRGVDSRFLAAHFHANGFETVHDFNPLVGTRKNQRKWGTRVDEKSDATYQSMARWKGGMLPFDKDYTDTNGFVQTRTVIPLKDSVEPGDHTCCAMNDLGHRIKCDCRTFDNVPGEISDKYTCCAKKNDVDISPRKRYKKNIAEYHRPGGNHKKKKICPVGYRGDGKDGCNLRIPGDTQLSKGIDYQWCYTGANREEALHEN